MPSQEDYERFFRQADKDGSGALSVDELIAILRKQGYKGSDAEIKKMFRSVDAVGDGDGKVSMNEYLQAMGAAPPTVHKCAAARQCFREFDKDGNGTINKAELEEVFKELGKRFSPDELHRMMELTDSNRDGTINYEEFVEHVFGGKG